MLAAEAEQKAAELRHWQRCGFAATAAAADRFRPRRGAEVLPSALDGAEPADSGEPLDTVRYYRAFLRYDAGDLEKAAGEVEAMVQSPNESAPPGRRRGSVWRPARHCSMPRKAKLARGPLATCNRWRRRSLSVRGSFPEADDARAVLCELAIAAKQLDKADDYLRQMSANSSRRGEAEFTSARRCGAMLSNY